MSRFLRHTGYAGLWVLNMVALVLALEAWRAWGFMALLALPLTHWGMKQVDPEMWAQDAEYHGPWWG